MDEQEIDKMLTDTAKLRESQAYQMGDGIRRGVIWSPSTDDRIWRVDVWDDEYHTSVIVPSPNQSDDSIKRIFLYLKGVHYRG